MTTYVCDYAWLGEITPSVVIEIDGEHISEVHADQPPPPGAQRLRGLTVPGLANAHSHAFHRALRGATAGRATFWEWRRRMYDVAAALDPERYHRLARAVFAEMALTGITCVGEFHYLHHPAGGGRYDDANAMSEALVAAAQAAGIRITLLDTCYLEAAPGRALEGVQSRFGDGNAEAWASRVDRLRVGPGACVGAAVHSVRAVPPRDAHEVAAWAAAHAAPLHVHVSEQPAENEQCAAAYGRTPAAVLADAGVLGGRTTAIHGTHLSEADTLVVAGSGTGLCMCPTTERDLADGIGPAGVLFSMGVPICLGSDSHAVIDMFEEARALELDERLATGARGHFGAADLVRAATEAGHQALGWHGAGRIAPGAPADLVTVSLDSARLAGSEPSSEPSSESSSEPSSEPSAVLDAVVFAATSADVTDVVASGRRIVEGGTHVRMDVAEALRQAIAEVRAAAEA